MRKMKVRNINYFPKVRILMFISVHSIESKKGYMCQGLVLFVYIQQNVSIFFFNLEMKITPNPKYQGP